MPELPEVESARAAIEQAALHRRIADVDDSDTYVCRPHRPGEIRAALVGRTFTGAHRQGKSMWLDTSGTEPDEQADATGPELALHLGMSGRIIVSGPEGERTEGGDYQESRAAAGPSNPVWDRFTVTFEDGGRLLLRDKRRLGRVRLEASRDALGPDAEQVTLADFRARVGRGPLRSRPGCWTSRSSPASGTCSPTRPCGRPTSCRADPRASSTRRSWAGSGGPCARRPGGRRRAAVCIPDG